VGRYRKDKTNVDFTEARDSEWQWHQLGHMQARTSLQRDNHANTNTTTDTLEGKTESMSNMSFKFYNCKLNLCMNLKASKMMTAQTMT